jgi:hypothetical protein
MTAWAPLALLGLLGGFGLAARRWLRVGAPAEERLRVVAHRRLDAQNALWVVEAEGRRLLVGTGRDGARLVADLDSRS